MLPQHKLCCNLEYTQFKSEAPVFLFRPCRRLLILNEVCEKLDQISDFVRPRGSRLDAQIYLCLKIFAVV